jgi:hypothetical protein
MLETLVNANGMLPKQKSVLLSYRNSTFSRSISPVDVTPPKEKLPEVRAKKMQKKLANSL